MKRLASFLLSCAILALLSSATNLQAQSRVTITPPELYSGQNEITVKAADGIKEIRTETEGRVLVNGDGPAGGEKSRSLIITVPSAAEPVIVKITVIDTKGRSTTKKLALDIVWHIDMIDLGQVRQGESICSEFTIRAKGSQIDGISSDDPRVSFELPSGFPIRVKNGVYTYKVCVQADAPPGTYKFPVILSIHRDYPSAGAENYLAADTGYVTILPVGSPISPAISAPSRVLPNSPNSSTAPASGSPTRRLNDRDDNGVVKPIDQSEGNDPKKFD